jgi:hypothetical protein
MCIRGSLTEFSLPEICQLIEKGNRTGLLTIHSPVQTEASSTGFFYIWVYRGRIVAAANRLDQKGLVRCIAQQEWIEKPVLAQLLQKYPNHQPLGLYLKEQGVLQFQHLKALFKVQVLQSILTLLQLKDGQFQFDSKVSISPNEMTGLSISATQASLIGLRALKNWEALAEQLPHPEVGLVSTISAHPQCQLNSREWQVWEYTNGTVSLKSIAKQLRIPVKQVQKIAYRLIAIDVVKAVTLFADSSVTQANDSLSAQLLQEAEKQYLNHAFLPHFWGFMDSPF